MLDDPPRVVGADDAACRTLDGSRHPARVVRVRVRVRVRVGVGVRVRVRVRVTGRL